MRSSVARNVERASDWDAPALLRAECFAVAPEERRLRQHSERGALFPEANDDRVRGRDLREPVAVDEDRGRDVRRTVTDLQVETAGRSEEHTSELQSLTNLVCRLLLEKKK